MEIRLATEHDAGQLLEIYGPFCHTPVSFEEGPPSVEEMRRRVLKTLDGLPWLVGADGGTLLGFAYAGPHRQRAAYRWSVDVSVYVRDGRRRCGLGRALYTSLLAALALQGFVNAYAGITLPNPASVGLHEALGFVTVGVYRGVGYKCGAWRDVGWWQKQLRERTPEPPPPADFRQARSAPGWEAALAGGLPHVRL
jgi:phosphinothricin acetyltransferase